MNRKVSTCLLIFLSLFAVGIGDSSVPNDSLSKLERDFEKIDKEFNALQKPVLGTKNFHKQLPKWSSLSSKRQKILKEYISSLFSEWGVVKDNKTKRQTVEKKLINLRNLETASYSNYGMQMKMKFSEYAHQYLTQPIKDKSQINFLKLMCKPGRFIRDTDHKAASGIPSEPFGWNVQNTYSLALMRAGEFTNARKENEHLLRKVDLLVRGKDKYYQKFYFQRALIEAHSGNLKSAKEWLAKLPHKTNTEDKENEELHQELISLIGS